MMEACYRLRYRSLKQKGWKLAEGKREKPAFRLESIRGERAQGVFRA